MQLKNKNVAIDAIIKPLVSICCMTYNHENYIRQCLDGFVMQQTSFPIEILVHEDASTDNTAEIVKEYEVKYPHLFKCIYQTENQFAKQNTLVNIIFPMSRGKYIALCEGDDYWTDPYKLQKQVNFLEANPDFSLCFHAVKILKEGHLVNDFITKVPADVTTIDDLLKGNYIYPLSTVFRNIFQNGLPKWFINCVVGDYPLFMLLAKHGKLIHINDQMGVYRLNDTGIWYSKDLTYRQKEWHKMLVYLSNEMEDDIKEKMQDQIINYYSTLYNGYKALEAQLSQKELRYKQNANIFNSHIGKMIRMMLRFIGKILSKN